MVVALIFLVLIVGIGIYLMNTGILKPSEDITACKGKCVTPSECPLVNRVNSFKCPDEGQVCCITADSLFNSGSGSSSNSDISLDGTDMSLQYYNPYDKTWFNLQRWTSRKDPCSFLNPEKRNVGATINIPSASDDFEVVFRGVTDVKDVDCNLTFYELSNGGTYVKVSDPRGTSGDFTDGVCSATLSVDFEELIKLSNLKNVTANTSNPSCDADLMSEYKIEFQIWNKDNDKYDPANDEKSKAFVSLIDVPRPEEASQPYEDSSSEYDQSNLNVEYDFVQRTVVGGTNIFKSGANKDAKICDVICAVNDNGVENCNDLKLKIMPSLNDECPELAGAYPVSILKSGNTDNKTYDIEFAPNQEKRRKVCIYMQAENDATPEVFAYNTYCTHFNYVGPDKDSPDIECDKGVNNCGNVNNINICNSGLDAYGDYFNYYPDDFCLEEINQCYYTAFFDPDDETLEEACLSCNDPAANTGCSAYGLSKTCTENPCGFSGGCKWVFNPVSEQHHCVSK